MLLVVALIHADMENMKQNIALARNYFAIKGLIKQVTGEESRKTLILFC